MLRNKSNKEILHLWLFLFILFNLFFIQPITITKIQNCEKSEYLGISSTVVTELWRKTTGNDIYSSAAIADLDKDGKPEVIVGSHDWYIYALNGEDGSELWKYRTDVGVVLSSPSIADIDDDGYLEVVVGAWDDTVYALNGEDGTQLWNFTTDDGVGSSPAISDIDQDGKLEVVVGCRDSKIYAINGEDGIELWNFTTAGMIYSSPAIGDINGDGLDEVITGCRNYMVYALNGSNGRELWNFEANYSLSSSVSLGDLNYDSKLDVIIGFSQGYNGTVYALNGQNGKILWTYEKQLLGEHAVALGDVDNDGLLEVGIGIHVLLNGEDGSPVWVNNIKENVGSSPAFGNVDGDENFEIVAGSYDYNVYAINCEDGTISWMFNTTSYVYASPALGDLDGDGKLEVVIGSEDHILYAIDLSDSGDSIMWQGFSGDLEYNRTKKTLFESQHNPPPSVNPALGKGIWIWHLTQSEKGNVSKIINRAKSVGLKWIAIKGGDGTTLWEDQDELTIEIIHQIQNAGLKILGWQYIYGEQPLLEANVTIEILNRGVDGFIINAEIEYEGKRDEAIDYLTEVREHYPSAFLAYSTFPIIDYHIEFPYIEFGHYCNASMPQDYWKLIGITPERMLEWREEQWNKWHVIWAQQGNNSSIKPIIPTGQGWNVEPDEILRYCNLILDGDYLGMSLWRYDLMSDEMWDAYAGIYFPQPSFEIIFVIIVISSSIGAFISIIIILIKRK